MRDLGLVDDSTLFTALLTQFTRRHTARRAAEEDPEVRNALDEVIRRLDTNDYLQVHRVRRALFPMGVPGEEALVSGLSSSSTNIRVHCATILGDLGGRHAAGRLLELLKDPSPDVVDAAGWSLMRVSGKLLSFTRPGEWIEWWAGVKRDVEDEPVHAINDSAHDMEPILRDLVQENSLLDPLAVEYTVGIPEWLGGQTRMLVHGTGRVLVVNRYKDEWNFFEGRVPEADLRAFLWTVSDRNMLHVGSERTLGATNESVHEVALRVGARHRCTSFLWYGELGRCPSFTAAEAHLRRILKFITRGRVW